MRMIEFSVDQQRIKNIDSVRSIYGGTDNYLKLKFSFSDDWNDCTKAISFGSKEIAKLLDNEDSCVVPAEAFDERQLSFYLVGKAENYRIQTKKFVIKIG